MQAYNNNFESEREGYGMTNHPPPLPPPPKN